MPVLSELAALEVANGLVGSSQLIAPLLCNELLGIAEAHAEHCLDLEDERSTPRRPHRKPCLAQRRGRPLALVAAAHGTVRILEQAGRAAVGTRALGVGRAASTSTPGISPVYFCRYTRVLPGVAPTRGKSYHRLIVLAGECLIVLVGFVC